MQTKLAEWLKAQLLEQRVSRNQVAQAIGVAGTTLTRITKHGHVPGPEIVLALADYFKADRDTLLEIAGIVQLSDLPPEVPPEIRELARRLYRLDAEDRQAILRQFDQLLAMLERHDARLA